MQIACCDHILSDVCVFFLSGNICWEHLFTSNPLYSVAYSYTFSVTIVSSLPVAFRSVGSSLKRMMGMYSPNPVFASSPHLFLCVCAMLSNGAGMRQPSQLEGYLGTCVLRESPRANALGMSHHGHSHTTYMTLFFFLKHSVCETLSVQPQNNSISVDL